jgi:hypothetical protein
MLCPLFGDCIIFVSILGGHWSSLIYIMDINNDSSQDSQEPDAEITISVSTHTLFLKYLLHPNAFDSLWLDTMKYKKPIVVSLLIAQTAIKMIIFIYFSFNSLK